MEHDIKTQNVQVDLKRPDEEFDIGNKSLSDALRVSFIILKAIIVILVVIFLASGINIVEPDEKALVLRFGKIQGVADNRLLGPGLHWVLPYPINEVVKIPVEKRLDITINDFWYYQRPSEKLARSSRDIQVPPALNPVFEGYTLTRSEKPDDIRSGTGSDYNIVHSRWQVTYKIDDPERFFKNIYAQEIKPGQTFADIIAPSVAPFLQDIIGDSVVATMVNYTIDEAISSQDRIPAQVKRLLQKKLDQIECGIKVVSVQLTAITWPRQVDYSFLASISASQASQREISQARGYAENLLSETAGAGAEDILDALKKRDIDEENLEMLWSQLAGQAQEVIANAKAYRTRTVETAKANAEYLNQILPEYRKRPDLVVQKIYQDAIEYVLNNADEKMVIQPSENSKGKEIRILLNRDPAIKANQKN